MAIDQYYDQKNAIIKGSCVAVGLTDNPPAHGSWMVVGPEVARMIAEFDDDTMTSHQKDSEHHHHEQHPGSICPSNICKRSQSLSAMVEEMGSPFLEDSEDLLALHTIDNMNVTVWETVRNVEIFGEEQYLRFVNERLIASDRVCKIYHRTHWGPSRGRSESAALGVCVYTSLYTHTLRVLPIHFGRETVPSDRTTA